MQHQSQSAFANGPNPCADPSAAKMPRAQICSNSHRMEEYEGLSGAIGGRAGFKGLWALGLAISRPLGYPDVIEASWSKLADGVDDILDPTDSLVDREAASAGWRMIASRANSAIVALPTSQ